MLPNAVVRRPRRHLFRNRIANKIGLRLLLRTCIVRKTFHPSVVFYPPPPNRSKPWHAEKNKEERRRGQTNPVALEIADADVAAGCLINVPPSDARITADDERGWLGKHVRHK